MQRPTARRQSRARCALTVRLREGTKSTPSCLQWLTVPTAGSWRCTNDPSDGGVSTLSLEGLSSMKLPTVPAALAMSLVTATAAISYATHGDDVVWDEAQRDVIDACLGYELLHTRLSSTQGEEAFRSEGRCVEVLTLKSMSSLELGGSDGKAMLP